MRDTILKSLSEIIDPEVGVNIVDLGLIYQITIIQSRIVVTMTMTSPTCPMGEMLMDEIKQTLSKTIPEKMFLDIELVWSPPWSPSMMSDRAKQSLGWIEE